MSNEQPTMEFRDLADLRLFLRELLDLQVDSLREYYDSSSGGFYHQHNKRIPGKFSKSSTATCVLSLIATNEWRKGPWQEATGRLVNGLLKTPWKSAGLPPNNVFTVGFVLEAVTELLAIEPTLDLDPEAQDKLRQAQETLRSRTTREIRRAGAVGVQGYPPSAYVTQLVVRTLEKQQPSLLDPVNRKAISDWAQEEINKQITLLTRSDKTADVFQLAYSVILLTNLVEPGTLTPDQEFITEAALEELFVRQRDDGTWPLSRPLFHYPSVGSAHCYDYEMLVQLLSEPRLTEKLLRFIPKLSKSAMALRSKFPLGTRGAGWPSGHHPQYPGPESWSTASVYHFAHAFERLIAEQIRRETFSYLGSRYQPPRKLSRYVDELPDEFLDCRLRLDGTERSLKNVVSNHVLKPLLEEERKRTVASGGPLPKECPVSIIFFGPPGTSKTRLADIIADTLGWPLLSIDASQFLRNGMDGVYAEADRIFGMLAIAERLLVLLDEFDEMVRARESATDVLSRFLTTAMLPKLHKINDNRRLVFVVATNHIEAFDVAIRRPGRFDVILQVMPPSGEEKLRKWSDLSAMELGDMSLAAVTERLEPLTYLETEILARRLATAATPDSRRDILNKAYNNCTLLSDVSASDGSGDKIKWIDVCEKQSELSRVP